MNKQIPQKCADLRVVLHSCNVQLRSLSAWPVLSSGLLLKKSPKQHGTGKGGMHAGPSKVVLIRIKILTIESWGICNVLLNNSAFKTLPHLPEERACSPVDVY